jgi:hypothetical protein
MILFMSSGLTGSAELPLPVRPEDPTVESVVLAGVGRLSPPFVLAGSSLDRSPIGGVSMDELA